jgi:glycosyltransferase involved in cell wall biosynthesis
MILIPCFNEADGIVALLGEVEKKLAPLQKKVEVVVINDGSTDGTRQLLEQFSFARPCLRFQLLNLPVNLGAEEAIFQGLLYARERQPDRLIVMDGDGQDDPGLLPQLLEAEADMVLVSRGRRAEGLPFRLAYWSYRLIFRLVTGQKMNFGHFCSLKRPVWEGLAHRGFVHFSAALLKLKGSRKFLRADRQGRMAGRSKVGYAGQLRHAFRSLVEFAEELVRLFLRIFVLSLLFFFGYILFILYHKFVSGLAISGWSSILSVGLLNLALLSMGFFVMGLLLLNLSYRLRAPNRSAMYEKPEPHQET